MKAPRPKDRALFERQSVFNDDRMLQLKVCTIIEEYGFDATVLALHLPAPRLTHLQQGLKMVVNKRIAGEIDELFQFIAQERTLRFADEKF